MRSSSDLGFWRWCDQKCSLPSQNFHSGDFGVWVPNLKSIFFPLAEQCQTFHCICNLLWRHKDSTGTFAESFTEVKRTRTSGQFQMFEVNNKQKTMTVVLWKLKNQSPVFILNGFGFEALKVQVFFKVFMQNEIISFCKILIGTFLYCPAWPSSYWSVSLVCWFCFTEKFRLFCVAWGLKTLITFVTAGIFSKAFLKKVDMRYKNTGA